MINYEKGNLIVEGKTKKVWEHKHNSNFTIIESKNDITKLDSPDLTEKFATKANCSTITTCKVFEFLKKAGIPVAFEEQVSETEFLSLNCSMLPLEVVCRRYAVGSYLKRNPHLTKVSNPPYRFHSLAFELFLKTTNKKFATTNGIMDLPIDDPLIEIGQHNLLNLYHPKKPKWEEGARIGKVVYEIENILEIKKLAKNVFYLLEGFFNMLDYHFIDLKIEFGICNDQLYVADVIDNDSWRLKNFAWEELSKENFRQGMNLTDIENYYNFVAHLVSNINIPRQALILWKGSNQDNGICFPKKIKDYVDVIEVILSGHQFPQKCINKLNELEAKYAAGGVILIKAGLSNGLGPMISASKSSNWQVISIPDYIENLNSIWSSIKMPSNVPHAIVCNEKNAIQYALDILGKNNPMIYALRQENIEKLDN